MAGGMMTKQNKVSENSFWRWAGAAEAVLGLSRSIPGYFASYSVTRRDFRKMQEHRQNFLSKDSFRVMRSIRAVAEEIYFEGWCIVARPGVGRMRAVVGSAAFFAIYHPPLSCFAVGCWSCERAWDFQKDLGRMRRQWRCHMIL